VLWSSSSVRNNSNRGRKWVRGRGRCRHQFGAMCHRFSLDHCRSIGPVVSLLVLRSGHSPLVVLVLSKGSDIRAQRLKRLVAAAVAAAVAATTGFLARQVVERRRVGRSCRAGETHDVRFVLSGFRFVSRVVPPLGACWAHLLTSCSQGLFLCTTITVPFLSRSPIWDVSWASVKVIASLQGGRSGEIAYI
jgi:hypothetical protein